MSGGALSFDPWAAIAAAEGRALGLAGLGDLGGLGGGCIPKAVLAPLPSPGLAELAGLGGGVIQEPISAPDPARPLVDHDAAEAEAMAAFYAAPALGLVGSTYCFPCGAAVPSGERVWSNARGWCCAACSPCHGDQAPKVVR